MPQRQCFYLCILNIIFYVMCVYENFWEFFFVLYA